MLYSANFYGRFAERRFIELRGGLLPPRAPPCGLVQRESNPYRFYSGGFTPMLCYCPWQYAEYYLRSMPRLNENPLRKNCKAHFGEECSRDFERGGRRLAGASQGRQVQKRRTGPPKCGTCSTPVGLENTRRKKLPLNLSSRGEPRKCRAGPIITCTYGQVGRLSSVSLLPTSGFWPGGLQSAESSQHPL